MVKKTLLCMGFVISLMCFVSWITNSIESLTPKYEFYSDHEGNVVSRCNKINGKVECYSSYTATWNLK